MMRIIGVDEAGYGPNLGPLVVTATLWEVPDAIGADELIQTFHGIVSDKPCREGRTIHIADSKRVHSASAGIGPLERSALALLELAGQRRDSFSQLWDELHPTNLRHLCPEPWFRNGDAALPSKIDFAPVALLVESWLRRAETCQCQLLRCAAHLVPAARFNRAVNRAGTKGRVLSETTLALVGRLWDPSDPRPTLILCDKHGGRARYGELIAAAFGETLPRVLEETPTCSRYRLGEAELRFRPRSEDQFPVAAASIIAKYMRELAMDIFNQFWVARMPDLRPTRGYPQDARRFGAAIAEQATELGLERHWYWRER